MNKFKVALFDLDGVLIDSERLYTEFWAAVGVRYGIPSPTFALDIKGTTLKDIFSKYFPDEHVRKTLANEIVDFEAKVVYPVYDGVKSFLEELNRRKPKTLDKIQDIWYKGNDGSYMHYHDSRYHCLNLHSLFSKGTIEFRLFNSTLHAGKIKAYIQFCLAITHQALTQKCASRRVTESTNEKYTFRTWLLRLGMIGEEFKTARTHLLSHLDGCIAWKNPEQAELQKERLRSRNADFSDLTRRFSRRSSSISSAAALRKRSSFSSFSCLEKSS